jgi:DNA polymerase elongation subunit (family B)
MVIQTTVGWILDISQGHDTDDIVILIKLQEDGKVISFKQKLYEYIFYVLPKSRSAGEDLIRQLSRYDQLIKRIFWDERYIDLLDKNKTELIGISLSNIHSVDKRDYKKLIQILEHDSRVTALYNAELSVLMQLIYTQLRIPPTSKVKIEYDGERLLSISRIDDSQEIAPPPFKMIRIEMRDNSGENKSTKLVVTPENKTSIEFAGLADPSFASYLNENSPDMVLLSGDYRKHYEILASVDDVFTRLSGRAVVIHSLDTLDNIQLLELVEKARFSYLPLKFASKYGIIKLIDSRITYELLQRNYAIPTKTSVSKSHEQVRTLENIVEMDKAGMTISPEIGLHENVAVLDYDNEYANLIINHNISYETLSNDYSKDSEPQCGSSDGNRISLLPSIIKDIVTRRIYLKQLLTRELEPDSLFYSYCQIRLEILKQILVCLYGTSGSIWNRYSNVRVFEEINRLSRQILMKTKDIVQSSGFQLIYADTDAVFLKKKDATKSEYEEIMNNLIKETGLDMTLEFHYKFLVLLYVEADKKLEARKHYYGLTYDNVLVTRGIDTRRHDSPAFIKQFQTTLLSKLFDCASAEEVLTNGYESALLYVTQSIDKIMNGEVQTTDLVICKLLRQDIEKYRSLFPHVAAAIRLNISGLIAGKGDNIEYIHTDSNHTDPLQRVTPAKLISAENYDREKYLEMLLDAAEAVLVIFGFSRSLYGFDNSKKLYHWWNELYEDHKKDIETAKSNIY